MRRRLLISTLIVAVTAVLLLGVPLAVVMSRLVTDGWSTQLTKDATDTVDELQYRADNDLPLGFEEFKKTLNGDYVVIYRNGKRIWHSEASPPPARKLFEKNYSDNEFTVDVAIPNSTVSSHVTDAMLLVAALSLLAVGVAVGLAFFQVRRFTRPLEELASAAVLVAFLAVVAVADGGDLRAVLRRVKPGTKE